MGKEIKKWDENNMEVKKKRIIKVETKNLDDKNEIEKVIGSKSKVFLIEKAGEIYHIYIETQPITKEELWRQIRKVKSLIKSKRIKALLLGELTSPETKESLIDKIRNDESEGYTKIIEIDKEHA